MITTEHKQILEQNRNTLIKEIFKTLKLCSLNFKTEAFVISLEGYFEDHGKLTDKQFQTLQDIYERVS